MENQNRQQLVRKKKQLQILLLLIAVHSICFGLALIVLPPDIIEYFGFQLEERFFAMQGGVFHIVISYAYLIGARQPDHYRHFIFMAVLAKFSATVFLIGYYFLIGNILIVLLSGIIDGMMGLAIMIFFRNYIMEIGSVPGNSHEVPSKRETSR
jgi:hypothetical protein